MRKKLKAKIYEKFGTQEKFIKCIKDDAGYRLHYSKLSRFINGYVDMTDYEKELIMEVLGITDKERKTIFEVEDEVA